MTTIEERDAVARLVRSIVAEEMATFRRTVVEAVKAAVLAEREQCALVAQHHYDVHGVGNCIADEIRRRSCR